MLVSHLTESIQRQDEMTKILGSSLKKAAKKIHGIELMMHNQPTEGSEAHEKKIWQEKMNKLLYHDVAKRLPTLKEIHHKNVQEEIKKSKQIASKRRIRPRKEPMYLSRNARNQTTSREDDKKKTSGQCRGMMNVPSCDGEVISIVKNYKGLNTSCGDERKLRRLDGRHSRLFAKSSLPDWIGPGYYADANGAKERPPSSYQVSFRNTGRICKNSEHYKEARMEKLSMSNSFSMDDTSRPPYSSSSACSRIHDVMEESDLICDNPWSMTSAQSTIGRPASQSGRQSPLNVIIQSPKKTVCSYECVLSDFISSPTNGSPQSTMRLEDSVDMNTLDPLVLVAADVDKRRYVNPDFAMGGLDFQQDIPVVTLADLGEVEMDKVVKPPKKTTLSKNRGLDAPPKSKAQKILKGIRNDLSQHKKSRIRGLDIPFTKSLSGLIDDWQSVENVISSRKYLKQSKRNTSLYTNNEVINLDQLLMEDEGMSYEEARSLVEEYSESIDLDIKV